MRCIPALVLGLIIASCGEHPPAPQQESRPAETAPSGPGGPPSSIPDQGAVTKTLGGATVKPRDQEQEDDPGDLAISAAIRKAILADTTLSARARDITVNTSKGKVTLRGTVESAAERSRIEILARDSNHAGAIDDLLRVEPQP